MAVAKDRTGADWLRAAARRLAADGVAAVAVETLARDIGVTKGSFYWHFRDRPALLAALLADWETRATAPLLARVKAMGSDPSARLWGLLATVAAEGGGALDPALRAWGLTDRAAAAAVERVDATRLDFIAGEFRALGFVASDAWTRARLLYLHLLGEHALALAPAGDRLAEARRVLELLAARPDGKESPAPLMGRVGVGVGPST
jgi:AcrR family transcriptional regulator